MNAYSKRLNLLLVSAAAEKHKPLQQSLAKSVQLVSSMTIEEFTKRGLQPAHHVDLVFFHITDTVYEDSEMTSLLKSIAKQCPVVAYKQQPLTKKDLALLKSGIQDVCTYDELLSRQDLDFYMQKVILKKRLKSSVLHHREDFQFFFENTPYPCIIWEKGSRKIVRGNRSAVELYGYPGTEMEGLLIDGLQAKKHKKKNLDLVEKNTHGLHQYTGLWHMAKNGKEFVVEINSMDIVFKGRECRLAMIRDITKTEQQKHTSKMLFRTVAAQFPNGFVALLDEKLNVLFTAGKQFKKTGIDPDSVIGTDITNYFVGVDHNFFRDKVSGIKSGQEVVFELSGRLADYIVSASELKLQGEKDQYLVVAQDITEKKQQEKQLQFHNSVLQNVNDSIVLKNRDGKIIFWNKGAEAIYGYKQDKVLNEPIINYLSKPERKRFKKNFPEVLKGKDYSAEVEVTTKDGRHKWMYSRQTPMRDNKGVVIGILGVSRDITELKKAREEVEESEANLKALFNSTREGYLILDKDFVIRSINKRAREMFKTFYGVEMEVDKPYLDYAVKNNVDTIAETLRAVKKGKTLNYKRTLDFPNKSHVHLELIYQPIKVQDGKIIGISVCISDITEQVESETKIRQREQQLNQAEKIAKFGSFEVNIKSNDVSYSEGLKILIPSELNLEMEGEAGLMKFYDHLNPEDRGKFEGGLNELLTQGKPFELNYRLPKKKGDPEIRWMKCQMRLETDEKGEPKKVMGTVQDITKQKQAEEEQRILSGELMKSNKDLKQFSFITSHNLRAPIANFKGLLDIYDSNDPADPFNQVIIDKLRQSTQQMEATLEDLGNILNIQKNVNVAKDWVNLEEVMGNTRFVLEYLISSINPSINLDLKVKKIYYNKPHLESIFLNMVSNALKYRNPKRKLRLKISSEQQNGYILLRFQDNGLGIDLKRYGKKLFGLYQKFHDEPDSKGMGLYIVKSQVEALGGHVNVESEVNKGSTFHIYLKKFGSPG